MHYSYKKDNDGRCPICVADRPITILMCVFKLISLYYSYQRLMHVLQQCMITVNQIS